jgi:hypothetical protein
VSSDAAIESQLAGRRDPKSETQGSAVLERQTLQSKLGRRAGNRSAFNRLGVILGPFIAGMAPADRSEIDLFFESILLN